MENFKKYLHNCIYLIFTVFSTSFFTEIISETVLRSIIFISLFLSFLIFRYQKDSEVQTKLMDCFFENQRLIYEKEQLEEDLKKLKYSLQEKILYNQIKYQNKIGKCIYPYCSDDSENLCQNHSKFKESNCPICFESFEALDIPLNCGHFIHRKCLLLTKKENCPLCKKENILDF